MLILVGLDLGELSNPVDLVLSSSTFHRAMAFFVVVETTFVLPLEPYDEDTVEVVSRVALVVDFVELVVLSLTCQVLGLLRLDRCDVGEEVFSLMVSRIEAE